MRLPPFQGHEALDVIPATADPIKTVIESWPPDSPIPTGIAHCMSIVPCDSFGNPGATGATFTVRMLYSGSNNVTPVTVTPSGTAVQGRLVATVIPKAVGNPALQARPFLALPVPASAGCKSQFGCASHALLSDLEISRHATC